MFRFLGACGLAITVSTVAQTAGGGAAAGGSAGTAGGAAAGASTGARVAAPSSAPRIAAPTAAGAPGQSVSGTAGQSVTATPGQSITTRPGQSVTGTAGQSTTTTPGQSTTAASPAQLNTTTTGATLPGQNPPPAGSSSGTVTTSAGAVSTPVAFTTLPANLQAQIANQIPPGSQLSQVVQEVGPQGNVTYRAQIMQNGVMREIALNPGAGATAQNFTTSGALNTAAQNSTLGIGTTSGLVTGTPIAFGSLPVPVQTALTTAAAGAPPTNLTFTPGANGAGVYRGMANGQPVEIRVGPNGQILPSTTRLANTTATTAASTNDLTIDDLPQAARDAVRTSMPFAEVTGIRRVESASGDIFDVTLRGEGKESRMRISENGTVIEENVELPVSIANTAPANTNQPPKLAFSSLPITVRDAINIRADQRSIRSLLLTNHNGKTTYMVDYLDKDALRHRFFIGKDGLVVNTVTNVLKIRPAGGDTVLVANLPSAARNAIQREAGDKVERVDKTTQGDQEVFVVTYLKDGEMQQMVLSPTGQKLDAVGAPATAETGAQNK